MGYCSSVLIALSSILFHKSQLFSANAWVLTNHQAGRQAIPFEIELDPSSQDILTPQGFANSVYQILRLEPGSGALHAPVCSTWIFMRPRRVILPKIFHVFTRWLVGLQPLDITGLTSHRRFLKACIRQDHAKKGC